MSDGYDIRRSATREERDLVKGVRELTGVSRKEALKSIRDIKADWQEQAEQRKKDTKGRVGDALTIMGASGRGGKWLVDRAARQGGGGGKASVGAPYTLYVCEDGEIVERTFLLA
jgi:hypothetical protein